MVCHGNKICPDKQTDKQLQGCLAEHITPPPTLTFQNLITSSPVAKGMTDEIW